MAKWETLKAAIASVIKTNNNQEITGQVLQNVLNNVISSIGENATFVGIATPTTNPGAPDGPVFYIANTQGTYSNFSGITVFSGEIAILEYTNSAWQKSIIIPNNQTPCYIISAVTFDTNPTVKYPTSYADKSGNNSTLYVKITTTNASIVFNSGKKVKINFSTLNRDENGYAAIPVYQSLYYDLATEQLKIGFFENTQANAVPLLHNEPDSIGGIMAPYINYNINDIVATPEIEPDTPNAGYIDASGNVQQFSGFTYSNKIRLKAGSCIILTSCVGTSASAIAVYGINTNAHITSVLGMSGSVIHSYMYYTTKDVDVIVGKSYMPECHYTILNRTNKLNTALTIRNLNPWKGKTMLCIGDSITDMGYWVNSLSLILETKVINRGESGTCIANNSAKGDSFCQRLDKAPNDSTADNAKYSGFPTKADLVFVFGGINDWGRVRDQELGTLTGPVGDKTTFYGALHYLLRGLKSRYPKAVICVINLLHTYKYNGEFAAWNEIEYNNPYDESQGYSICENTKGNTLEDYRTAIKEVAEFYSLPVIDMTKCGMSFLDNTDRARYTADGLHPNEAAGVVMAKYIAAQLKSIN